MTSAHPDPRDPLAAAERRMADFRRRFLGVREEIGKALVGQQETVEQVLIALFAGGHVLVEGVPGVGKTLLAKSLSEACNLTFRRIQATVDLMPADITGTRTVVEDAGGRRELVFAPGPIFCHVLLADEINRATPKTQSALLEAMGELQVTVAGQTYPIAPPFFVMATRNPIEMEGTYPLPEAQLDRFLFSVTLPYPSATELVDIIRLTTGDGHARIAPAFAADEAPRLVEEMKALVREVVVAPEIEAHIVAAVRATIPQAARGSAAAPNADLGDEPLVEQYVEFGSSPRGAQALALGARVRALLDGRAHVTHADVDRVMVPALCHRLVLNFAARADDVAPEAVIEQLRARTRAAWG
jgi:MoxR-like ATPase